MSATELGAGDASKDKGLHRRTAGLCLGRWDLAKPCTPDNLVLLKEDELVRVQQLGHTAWGEQHPAAAAYIQGKLAQVAAIFGANSAMG
jgi:hypothetical protein